MLNFGNTYVSLPAVCVDAGTLRIADPRLDNGARVSAEHARGQVNRVLEVEEYVCAVISC
jgi:hypothetical protein